MAADERTWAVGRRVVLALLAEVLVVVLCSMVRSIAHAGDRGLVQQFVAGVCTYFLVWLWLYHRDTQQDAP